MLSLVNYGRINLVKYEINGSDIQLKPVIKSEKYSLLLTLLYAPQRKWLLIIRTLFALTQLPTHNPRIEAFTVFFLTLRFLTVTTLQFLQVVAAPLILYFYGLFCFFNRTLALLVIIATVACTLWSAELTRREALAVHFEALGLLTYASCALFFRSRSWLCVLSLTFQLDIQRNLQRIIIIINVDLRLADVLFYKRQGAGRKITFSFDQLKCFVKKHPRRQVKILILRQ